ncbi:MAG: carboxypeptidase regulatory-like domain-containing protein [Acidobacteria bacterium]|nr:MAG: carboxypeptidase regulatory-like domain-containing protein [Acidobacteriota bacterium]
MYIVAGLLLILFFFSSKAQAVGCGCRFASAAQTTFWGKENIILKEPHPVRLIQGKVIAGGRALSGVLVEIYDNPESLLMDWREREAMKSRQQRIAACVTSSNGKFCFPKLSSGRYEVRFSKATDFDSTSIYVIVDPTRSPNKGKKLIVEMQLSH